MDALNESGAVRLLVARFPWQRALGLIGRRSLAPGQGLLIPRCAAIHTVGMRFPIDIVFVDRRGDVLRIDDCVPPFRFRVCRGAEAVVELAAGASGRLFLGTGMTATISHLHDGWAWLHPGREPGHLPHRSGRCPARLPERLR